uniref:Uncharacterized protein n=1 Tax=Anguilla anguilla TaxID=7936 RepID=A0A0E9U6R2_ANGAN
MTNNRARQNLSEPSSHNHT